MSSAIRGVGVSKKGSALIFAILLLSLILVSALSIAAAAVSDRKNSNTARKSVAGFQVADSGAEIILQKIRKGCTGGNPCTRMNTLVPVLPSGWSCGGSCGSNTLCSGGMSVMILDTNSNPIACNNNTTTMVYMKSLGEYSDVVRAIQLEL